jgi:sugar lactone lactonase YvrE
VIRVDPDGAFTVVAGSGAAGYSGDGGPATAARLHSPSGIAADREGNVYVADTDNHRIRKIDADGMITTVAGTGRPGLSGDGWRASSVDLWHPVGVDVDAAGNVYVAEASTYRVRRVGRDGRITTIAGTGRPGFDGDGGPATKASLQAPVDIAVDAQGNVYIADRNNNRVRRVSP